VIFDLKFLLDAAESRSTSCSFQTQMTLWRYHPVITAGGVTIR
jgi:hypothetical protein